MSASGILRANNVIFYHPLDDNTEFTQNVSWSGVSQFVPGTISDAISPVVSGDKTIFPSGLIKIGTFSDEASPISLAVMTESSIAAAWGVHLVGGGNGPGEIKAGIISGSQIIWGDLIEYNSDAGVNHARQGDLVSINPSSVAIGYSHTLSSVGAYVRAFHIDGIIVSMGEEYQFTSIYMDGELRTAKLDTDKIILFYSDGTSGPAVAKIANISGTTVSFGSGYQFSATAQPQASFAIRTMTVVALTPSSVVAVTTKGTAGTGEHLSKVGIIGGPSGTDISWGSGVVPGSLDSRPLHLDRIDDNTVILFKTGNGGGSKAQIGSIVDISGIVWGEEIEYRTSNFGAIHGRYMGNGNIVLFYSNSEANAGIIIGHYDGVDLTFGSEDQISPPKLNFTNVEKINETKFVLAAGDFDVQSPNIGSAYSWIGTLDATLLSSGITGSGSYPSVSGDTRIIFAMWSRNISKEFSVSTIERGYTLGLTSDSISFGNAIWDTGDISSLLDFINNDAENFIIFDFENMDGVMWVLNTSVNGLPFVNRGSQSSGSQIVLTVDTNPFVQIAGGLGQSQWIDELVLWAGNKAVFTQFTNEELSRVYELANTFGVTMDQYGTPVSDSFDMYIAGPVEFSGSTNLYTQGPLPHNDNMNLFVKGLLVGSDGTTLRTINRFTKTSDHDPQLIGTFAILSSGVNIEVWDVVDGQNTLLALSSSGCYQIGNTDRWSWSTAGLPLSGKKKYHYYYRMTSTVAEEQLGEFFLTVPEGGRWSYPDSFGTHLVS